ncbi:hypothetical protein AVEN_29551-1, partial [Araneus ventricosus]
MLKTALEGKIKLKDIQVEVLSCRPIQGNGIVVKTKTPEMLEKLKTTIMNDLTLRDKCQVYIPKPRVPHIIIFDIPPQDGDQAAHENNFIIQLKESNELTDQEIKVVFKKKGRGSLQNWILAMQPKNYQEIKDKKRLRCGFNSYRFKEFLEPLRCFGCYRFGHLKRNCRETKPTCTKCTANHDPIGCTKPHPICRNCVLYNNSTNLKAAPLVFFILKYDLINWNDKDSEPTFETVNGKSWIDITMSSANLANKKRKWQILKICKAVHQKFLELQQEIQVIDSKQKLEKWIEELTITINQISQSFPRKVIKHLRVPWWDSELEDEVVWNFDNQRGFPQGSCSGPLFWNLVMDSALDLPLPQGSHIQAYADDIIVVIR